MTYTAKVKQDVEDVLSVRNYGMHWNILFWCMNCVYHTCIFNKPTITLESNAWSVCGMRLYPGASKFLGNMIDPCVFLSLNFFVSI